MTSFRPLIGDLSSLQILLFRQQAIDVFPSPYRGLIFLTALKDDIQGLIKVSVPLQGTYLPYSFEELKKLFEPGFRPLTGDLSSLLKRFELLGYKDEFPSPYRGLIFLTIVSQSERVIFEMFPSPYRGLIFLTGMIFFLRVLLEGFRPLTGDLSSLRIEHGEAQLDKSFRPLTGDLSSLPKKSTRIVGSLEWFPSPYRGLIFLTIFYKYYFIVLDCFRPLTGDLSSLRSTCWGNEGKLIQFPSPYRGLIFLTKHQRGD